MIRVRMMGQFGNQLFQYCWGKILAERTGQLYVPPREFVDKRSDPVKWSGSPLFTMHTTPGRKISGHPAEFCVLHWFDLNEISGNVPIHFRHGYYQRYELFRPWKQKIRQEWLPVPADRLPATDDDAAYVHVRRTDYVDGRHQKLNPNIQGVSTTIDEFSACLDLFPSRPQRLVIVTDDAKDPFLADFDKIGLPWSISGGTWDQDFLTLAAARQMVMSQSTFSWWAGFLGQCETIVCPMFPGSFWRNGVGMYGPPAIGQSDYPNLYVDDEEGRWIWKM